MSNQIQRHWLYYGVVGLYLLVVIPQLFHGAASLDAHGILASVQKLAAEGRITVSRPPGHPTTEIYFYPAIAILLRFLGGAFSEGWYLALQAVAGVLCLELFYKILTSIFSPVRSAFMVACLAFSPIFLANSFDGEEFTWATALLLFAVWMLFPRNGVASVPRVALSMLAFALATGCRPEAIICGWIYPLYFTRSPRFGWRANFWALPVLAVLVLLVWLPLLFSHDMGPPTGSGMSLTQSILGASYKLSFLVFTPVSILLLAWALVRNGSRVRRLLRESHPADAILTASVLISFSFLVFFFRRPDKPAYLLCGLPFALLLVATQPFWISAALAGITLLNDFVRVDVFQDRQLSRPFFTRGYYLQAASRAGDRHGYFERLAEESRERPTLCIANAWEWDFDSVGREGTPPVLRVAPPIPAGTRTAYRIGAAAFPLFFSREIVQDTNFLHRMDEEGYAIEVDRLLFRSTYEKYDVWKNREGDRSIDGIPVKLF
jgi:hypothetical protein